MSAGNIKNRLQVADETIAILRSSNSQLDRNLAVLQSDFSVMESLLIESGQTLQRLQEMVRFASRKMTAHRVVDLIVADPSVRLKQFVFGNYFKALSNCM